MVEKISDPPPPSGFLRWLFRLPVALYRAGMGGVLGSRFILVEHKGRLSGKDRQVVLEVVKSRASAGSYFVVSAWGEKADWYQNIQADVQVEYQVGARRYHGTAQVLSRAEAGEIFVEYGKRHPRMLQKLMRFVGYRIAADEAAYRELAKHLPVVKLSPVHEEED